MSYLILGASSGLGRELAYVLGKNLNNLILISRDEKDLKALKTDLETKFNIQVKYFSVDVSSVDETKNFIDGNSALFNEIKGVMFPIGMIAEDDTIYNNVSAINSLMQANLGAIAYFLSKIFPIFKKRNSGIIVGFGSVSSSLGRDVNTIYASSKRGLESLFESLSIEALHTQLNIQFYTIGYLNTNLSYGKKTILPKGSSKTLAQTVYKNLNKKYKKIYYPYWWSFIVLMIKILPFFVIRLIYKFNKNK